jgi:hypothetical protein
MAFSTSGKGSATNQDVSLSGRQRLLLGLLDAFGGTMGNLDFQKVLFLYCQEPDSGKPYDFVPYKRGAFSFTSYADRRKLIAYGLIEDDEHQWRFTKKGRDLTQPDMLLTGFVCEIGDLRGDELVAESYRRFPYYAIRSEIADRVLKGEDDALARITVEKQTAVADSLQTIGYEGHSLESYLNLLIKSGVTVLCDVRRNPMSRKYGFAKSTLSNACAGVGIRYEHLPELGIASEFRQDLQNQDDYDALFAEYEREWLPKQTAALQTIQSWMSQGERVALTCYEHLPHQCHRHCVSEALEAMSQNEVSAKHL